MKSKKPFIILATLLITLLGSSIATATLPNLTPPPPGGYDSGSNSILDPGCAPNAVDCFVNLPSGGSVTPTNGLSLIGSDIGLGGILTQHTTIDQDGFNLSINNNGYELVNNDTYFFGLPGVGPRYTDSITNEVWMSGIFDSTALGGGIQTGAGYLNPVTNIIQSVSVLPHLSVIASRNFVTNEEAVISTKLDGDIEGWSSLKTKINAQTGRTIIGIGVQRNTDNQQSGIYMLDTWEVGIGALNGVTGFQSESTGELFQVFDKFSSNPIARFTNQSGFCQIDHTGFSFCSSDERLKSNITPVKNALSTITQLHPVTYTWKNNPEKLSYGFIAQQVQPVFPDAVKYDTKTDTYGLDYQSFNILTIKAIQELNLKVDMLQIANGNSSTNVFESLIAWFESTTNGIRSIVVKDKICVDDQCLTKDDIRGLLEMKNQGNPTTVVIPPVVVPTQNSVVDPVTDPASDQTPTDQPTTDPVPTTEPEQLPTDQPMTVE